MIQGVRLNELPRQWIKSGMPGVIPPPIPDKHVRFIAKRIPCVKGIDDADALTQIKWNDLCAKRVSGFPVIGFENIQEVREWITEGAHHPELGLSVVRVRGRTYLVGHRPRAGKRTCWTPSGGDSNCNQCGVSDRCEFEK